MEELGLLRPYRYPAVLMFHCSCQSSSPFDPLWGGSFTAASRKDPRSLWIGVRQIFWKPGGVDLKKNGWLELGNCLEMLGKCLEFWMITSFPKWQWGMPHTDTSELNWRRFFWNGLNPPTGIVISLSRNKHLSPWAALVKCHLNQNKPQVQVQSLRRKDHELNLRKIGYPKNN